MPNDTSKRLPKYRKHKRSGNALVVLNDREIYLGKHNSPASLEKYNRLVAEWLQSERQSCDSKQEITVAEVMAAYIGFAKGYYRKDGNVTREYGLVVDICRVIKPLYGRALAVEFGPLSLKTVRQALIDSDVSRKHINKQIDRVKRMFKWAAGEELIPADIPQALGMVTGLRKGRTEARETAPVQPVADSVVDTTLEHLPAVLADMVRFQRLTGARPGEVCKLRPCDLNRSEEIWTYRPESHKTEHHGRDRIVRIGPQAQAVLRRYLARGKRMNCFRPCDSEQKRRAAASRARITPESCGNTPGSNVKRTPKRTPGRRYSTDTYGKAIKRACVKAKVEKWAPNQLRHSSASEIRSKFGLEGAQVILGHASADVTQVYAERDEKLGTRIAREIG
jgi:integrase